MHKNIRPKWNLSMPKESWAINIDIEGFSKNYEESEDRKTYAIWGLHQLMDAVIKIGNEVYPDPPERLFAHQFGDGFLIASDFYEESSDRPIAIATALMRHMLLNGYATKAAISTGGMSDIKGCYPKSVRDSEDGSTHMGAGVLTSIPVMGTALTRAHKLSGVKSGFQLIVDTTRFRNHSSYKSVAEPKGIELIDWLNSEISLAGEIAAKAGLSSAGTESLAENLEKYIKTAPEPPESWIASSRKVLCQ